MAKKVTFQLDLTGGEDVLTKMAGKQVKRSAEAIASRAQGMTDVTFEVEYKVGTIKRGVRSIGKITAQSRAKSGMPSAHDALRKSINAGRVQ